MKMHEERSTRSALLRLLKMRGSCSTSEMAEAMGITEMAIRRHIQSLEKDGIIRSTLVRQAMGRPSYRYSLTDSADDLFPKNYSQLALDLLDQLESHEDGDERIARVFEGRRDRLERRYRSRISNLPPEQKIAVLTEIQNESGYMAECAPDAEARGTYTLHQYNCPVAKVARQYRHACHCERQLFERLLDADVERTECLAEGHIRCTYKIRYRQ